MARSAAPLAVLLVAVLAGCSDAPAADADPTVPGIQDVAPAPFSVQAAPWQVGDWWSHHWVFEGQGAPDFTVKTIVAANTSGTYTFATDNLETAAQHGAFFFMDLGTMDPAGVMTAGQYAFPWMGFPLTHNKTWTASETNLIDGFEAVTRQMTMTARLNETGGAPRFDIEGTVDGALAVRYDYTPALGWFETFQAFRPDENGTPQLAFTITNEGAGEGYTGPVLGATGEMLVNEQPVVHPGSSSLPLTTVSFATGPATHVFAILFSFGAAGGEATNLLAPDGQRWTTVGAGDADGNPVANPAAPSGLQVLTPAQPGDWRVDLAAGGVVAGGGAFVWGVAVTNATL